MKPTLMKMSVGKLTILMVLIFTELARAQVLNGFDLSSAQIPVGEIKRGGPPKDGIPALNNPKFITAKEALKGTSPLDRALVVKKGKVKKVYPISILNWHEIVNDKIDDLDLTITFCPLCGTGMVFYSEIGGQKHQFGVSGLLYNSDVLLYDKKTGSLWSQIAMKAVTGKLKGKKLKLFPSTHLLMKDYLERNSDALVLSRDTGFSRNYSRDPYAGYDQTELTYFEVKHLDKMYPLKTWTLLAFKENNKILVPIKNVKKSGQLKIKLGKKEHTVMVDLDNRVFHCDDANGLECATGFWFALRAFNPKAPIYKP